MQPHEFSLFVKTKNKLRMRVRGDEAAAGNVKKLSLVRREKQSAF
jgi:hypothetical protein